MSDHHGKDCTIPILVPNKVSRKRGEKNCSFYVFLRVLSSIAQYQVLVTVEEFYVQSSTDEKVYMQSREQYSQSKVCLPISLGKVNPYPDTEFL